MSLSDHGVAHYTTERWEYSIPPAGGGAVSADAAATGTSRCGTKRGPFRSEHTVYFDYPQLRFNWQGEGVSADDPSAVVEECYICDGRSRGFTRRETNSALLVSYGPVKPI